MGTGLVIGKFLPPHRGHAFLIETALRQVDRLVVLVCSLEREPIPGWQRVAWLGQELQIDMGERWRIGRRIVEIAAHEPPALGFDDIVRDGESIVRGRHIAEDEPRLHDRVDRVRVDE